MVADHLDRLDTACGDVGIAAPAKGPRVNTDSAVPPKHCPVCHYLRAVSGAAASEAAQLSVVDGIAVGWVFRLPALSDAETTAVASRGPPHLDPLIVS